MERFLQQPCDPKQLSPLTLAFIGDAVFEVFVRERLVCQGNCSVNKLHKRAVEQVCCQSQAAAAQRLLPLFDAGGAGGLPARPQRPRYPRPEKC